MESLAINGGKPTRETFLSYGRQCITDEDVEAVSKVLKGDYLTTGPKILEFEEKAASFCGAKYAVAVSNGTAALHGACYSAGITEGDEVIVSPMTFAASSNCILYCGGKPVFSDVLKDTLNLDPAKIEEKITKKTKAIIAVDFAGHPAGLYPILKIAEKYNLILIEDGAHSFGSTYYGKKIGSISNMTTFSFHPVKAVTTGEGGIITTEDEKFYNLLKAFRTHGIVKDKAFMTKYDGPWFYEQQYLGYNYRISDIACALGISQMDKLESFINRRREIARLYDTFLKEIDEIELPVEKEYVKSSYHIYVIKLKLNKLKCTRREVYEALQKENIGVNVHYIPVYLHPYYKSLGYKEGLCKNAEEVYKSIITLPIYPLMKDKDVFDVVQALNKVINYYKK